MSRVDRCVTWFVNPSQIRHIFWEDLDRPCEETVNFEPNGNLNSKYLWARRKSDNKFMRVGIIKTFFVLPFLFGLGEFVALYSFLNSNSLMVELFCCYFVLLLLFLHFLLRSNERGLSPFKG